MMENQKEVNLNTLILFSLVFLFLAFIIIQPVSLTGLITLPLIGDTSELSGTTLIGAVSLLLAIWIVVFMLFKKLRKKNKLEKVPALPEFPGPVSGVDISSLDELQKKQGLTEDELKQLFTEVAPQIEIQPEIKINEKELELFEKQKLIQEKPSIEIPKRINTSKPIISEDKPKDINELRKIAKTLLAKNYTKESVIKYLQKKGWGLSQIAKVIQEINLMNLSKYLKEAVSLGYKKDQLVKQLLSKGWTNQEINDAIILLKQNK